MSVLRVPGLRIELAKDGKALVMTDVKGTVHVIPCKMADTYASSYRKDMKGGLDQLKDCVRKESLSVKDALAALGKLNQCGLTLVWRIFGEHCNKVEGIFQECFRGWRHQEDPAVITVAAEVSRFVPLEFLPLFDLSDWPERGDRETLEVNARRFPGFSAIIRREFPNLRVSQDLLLENDPKLPLKCFYYRGLSGADPEIGFFEKNAGAQGCLDFDGPWPERELHPKEFSKSLARHLRYADRRFDGKYHAPMDQIQHFVCHCETDEDTTSNARLFFSAGNVSSIAELQAWFAIFAGRRRRHKSTEGPLIFLNACGTSRIDPMAVTSFPQFFLEENGNRGFIGTETNVPDAFAADFSQRFYRSLLKGLNLGKAMREAKWEMLRDENNPLGILYILYADPDMRVKKPVGSVS